MILSVKVIPRAKRTEIVGYMDDGSLKIRLKAVPEDGKANEELLGFLAEKTGISRDQIQILSGHTNSRKRVEIRGVGKSFILQK